MPISLMTRWKERIVRHLASSHIAGPFPDDALAVCRSIDACGWSATLGFWGSPAVPVRRAAALYDDALGSIMDARLNTALSIKIPTLGNDRGLIHALLDHAREGCIQVRFDALDPASADGAFRLVEYAAGYYRNIACTLPSRWKRSLDNLERVIDWGIGLRIVKGQWPDPGAPKINARENFRSLVDLAAGRCANVSIASHDRPLVHESIVKLKKAGVRCEVEQMLGLPVTVPPLVLDMEVPLRIYVPFGSPYLPYNMSFIRSRPAILSWAVRDLLMTREQKVVRLLGKTLATSSDKLTPAIRQKSARDIVQGEESTIQNEV